VWHEGSEVCEGFLSDYDLDHNFSVVKVRTSLEVNVGLIDSLEVNVGLIEHAEEILPKGEVIALARGSSGELIAKKVILTQDLSESEDNEYDEWPMLKIMEVHLHSDMSLPDSVLLCAKLYIGGNKISFVTVFQYHIILCKCNPFSLLIVIGLGRWSTFFF
jgi:hypothetical protein